jgi:two-component system, response regulator FlrC
MDITMRLMIIGDLKGYFGKATKIALDSGVKVNKIDNIETALNNLRSGKGADLIMVDVAENIDYLVQSLSKEHIVIPIIACGVDSNKELAVKAIQAGAKEYIPLPPDEKLISAIFESIINLEYEIVTNSPIMQHTLQIANQVAASNATILITGKSGTGKEVMARYIHAKSKNKNSSLISVNCAAIPENLLESELFGHEKGAFTGAIATRIGKFEESHNGTLLLDEISEIDIKLQAKLLRAIQEQEICRVGGNKNIKLNLRILATSNRDLIKEVKNGNFREDLYFRLNVINLELPTLAERQDDIITLANYFIEKYCKSNNLPKKQLNPEVATKLLNYHWPGNIRELENTIFRAVLLSPGDTITTDSVKLIYNDLAKENLDRDQILEIFYKFKGNTTKTANALGLSINSLKEKMLQFEDL